MTVATDNPTSPALPRSPAGADKAPRSSPPPAPHRRTPGKWERRIAAALAPLASLKLTVTLFALSIFLVFAGTLAQVHYGLWTVMDGYFRTGIAWIDVGIFFPAAWHVPGTFPFPGGWLLGAVLLVNLLAAHVMRFTLNFKRVGIWLIHTGLIVLLLSELFTGLFAEEGQMPIPTGGSSNVVLDIRETEIAVLEVGVDPIGQNVVAVPESRYDDAAADDPAMVADASLPFELRVLAFMPNARLEAAEADDPSNPATAGPGLSMLAQPLPPVPGTQESRRRNMPAAYIEAIDRQSGDSLGVHLLARELYSEAQPAWVETGGRQYALALRDKHIYKPYQIRLLEFTHDRYPGTDTPRDYRSRVELIDQRTGERREAAIWMNHPLRHAGETFYQSGVLPDDRGTILQVVDNPGYLVPYIACALISLGLAVHFLIMLSRFLRRRLATR